MSTEIPKKYSVLIGFSGLCIVALGVLLFLAYQKITSTEASLKTAAEKVTTLEAELVKKNDKLNLLAQTLEEVKQAFALSEETGAELLNQLTSEKDRNDAFAKQITDMRDTVGDLDKLAKTDEELLKKYSKVYFLNEHYMPGLVDEIPEEYLFTKNTPEHIHEKVDPYLKKLLRDAKEDGVELLVVSAYRSFDEQKVLKGAYTVQYGSGANAFSADQGYSEHQLGTTVDFTTQAIGGGLTGFETTAAYTWLQDNAHQYGFVLSYPKGNAYYVFEPWHWRYVGTKLATDLHKDGAYFYDWDQRKIDEYLISLFD